jgi:hypothetical protein
VTVNTQEFVLVQLSVTTHATELTPLGKVDPLGGVQDTVTPPQASVAVTVKVTLLLLHWPGSALKTRLDEQVMDGGVVSRTVMVWVQTARFVDESTASHVRVALKVSPQSTLVIVPVTRMLTFVPSQRSMAVGESNSHGVPHSTERLGAQ